MTEPQACESRGMVRGSTTGAAKMLEKMLGQWPLTTRGDIIVLLEDIREPKEDVDSLDAAVLNLVDQAQRANELASISRYQQLLLDRAHSSRRLP